jgi:hypothetical protein
LAVHRIAVPGCTAAIFIAENFGGFQNERHSEKAEEIVMANAAIARC